MYIEKINSPADVKKLSVEQMNVLASEIRTALLDKISAHGGHFGPNFGMVEATIALHYVFNSPVDKIVFDVSHQSYVHKMLTGRKEAFLNPADYDEVSGYSEPSESEHDFFVIGHTSTSVSLASGLAKARDLAGRHENIIAVIGDGSLSGGEAFEGFDFAAELHSNMIIIVNDNQMSIAENHGGIYEGLKALRDSDGANPCNLFKAMGFGYTYVKDGNDVGQLIAAFREVKDTDRPVVVHINTVKGKGYKPAEENKEEFHYMMPFDKTTGKLLHPFEGEDYSDITAEHLLKKMKEDPMVAVITAGTPGVIGFDPERRKEAGHQFIDVGIAEEHAVAMASGMAKAGGKPVFGVVSTFIQRAYDQLSQDLCINDNPAVLTVSWGSLTAMNDATHLCWFDIPLLSNIPNLVYLAPTTAEEYLAMLDWAIDYKEHPVAIRIPMSVVHTHKPVDKDYSNLNHYKVEKDGSQVAILAVGSFFSLGELVAGHLKTDHGIDATLINPRYISGLDSELLEALKENHRLVVTLEDGVIDGGFGEKIARWYGDSSMKTLVFGGKKEFADRFDPQELLKVNHLTEEQIVEDILKAL